MELPDKSAPQRPPEKKVQQVVSGAVLSKRPATRRLKDYLMAESPKVLMGRIARDVLVPRGLAALEEGANSFIAGMFWGGERQRPASAMVKGMMLRGGGVNYAQISNGVSPLGQAMQANMARPAGNYEDVVCPDEKTAEFLLANMIELMTRYNVVTVADLYEAAGLPTTPSHGSYGWYNFTDARIVKHRHGVVLELPRPSII